MAWNPPVKTAQVTCECGCGQYFWAAYTRRKPRYANKTHHKKALARRKWEQRHAGELRDSGDRKNRAKRKPPPAKAGSVKHVAPPLVLDAAKQREVSSRNVSTTSRADRVGLFCDLPDESRRALRRKFGL